MRKNLGIRYAVSIRSFILYSVLSLMLYYQYVSLIIPRVLLLNHIGCCCDSRRAVLIYSIIFVIFEIIGLIAGAAYQSITSAVVAILIVGIIIRFITIGGACMFSKWMVGLGATWEIIYVILSIVYAVRSSVNGTVCNGIMGCTYYSTPTWLSIVWALFWSGLILYVSSTF